MNARCVPSEFTVGAWWVLAECTVPTVKLSKSDKASQWFLVSSWSSKEAAEDACVQFRRL